MTDARSQTLGAIRRSLGRGPLDGRDAAEAAARLDRHPRNLVPARTDIDPPARIDLFLAKLTSVAGTFARVAGLDDVPAAVADFLSAHNLPATVKAAPDPALASVPWAERPTLEVTYGKAEDTDLTSVTGAVAAIAETGTLMLASGRDSPTTLNFMPDNHLVVVRAGQVVGPYEDAWDLVRRAGALPRTVNFITGPSRTGDIEQKIELGAHGPRRLHVILVDRADG
ncbi:MAG: LutC/YkgG family protein [Inquilinaceae bacterium]